MNDQITGKKTSELARLLEAHRGERHAVVMQDFPDPDAISCAYAYQQIAAVYDIEADILYGGRLSHQENIALVNLLGIELLHYNQIATKLNAYQGCAFVDGQGTTSRLTEKLETAGIPILALVDHHADQARIQPPFFDLRPVGACASMFTHYIEQGILPITQGDPEFRKLATALMHGIISETASMTRAQQFDFTAAAFLQPHHYPDLLLEVLHQQRSHKVMEVIRIALANRLIREGYSISGVGFIRSDDRDAIPQAADFLLTEENVHTTIVYGVVSEPEGGEAIHGSLRTTKHTLAPDTFIKEALGQANNGSYYGGGKTNAGGFEIPLGFLSGLDDPEFADIKWEAFNTKIRKKFLEKIGVVEKPSL